MRISLDLCDELTEKTGNQITIFSFPMRYIPLSDLKTLTYQYRMHKDIMNIVNQFYDGYLKDGNEDKYNQGCKEHGLYIHSTSGTSMIIPERHAYWFDSSELDGEPIYEQRKPGSTSAENIYEA